MIFGAALNWLIGLAVAGGLLLGAYWKGWLDGSAHEQRKWLGYAAEVQQVIAREREEYREIGRRLVSELAVVKEKLAGLNATAQERIIVRTRVDRRCLDSDITRLLNSTSRIRETTAPAAGAAQEVAPAAGHPDRHSAEDDGSGASERSVATNLLACRTGYEGMREQLHALIDDVTPKFEQPARKPAAPAAITQKEY